MNPLLDDATLRQKLGAVGFLSIRVGLGAVAWFCSQGIWYVFGSTGSEKANSEGLLLVVGAVLGAVLMAKYFEDLVFVSRHGFSVARWFDSGLRRPLRRFVPNLVGTFIGFNIVDVLQGKYWKVLMILPWTITWVAIAAGFSPVLRRLSGLRKVAGR